MYHHIKKLMYTVNIGTPDVRFGNMLLEQFGGANGELAAAMQYDDHRQNTCDVQPIHPRIASGTLPPKYSQGLPCSSKLSVQPYMESTLT